MHAALGFVNISSDEIFVAVAFVAIFFIARRVNLWYWRIDRMIALLESIDRKLDGDSPHGSA